MYLHIALLFLEFTLIPQDINNPDPNMAQAAKDLAEKLRKEGSSRAIDPYVKALAAAASLYDMTHKT